jgi:hypothetical protein
MKSSWKSLSLVLSATVALSIALNLLQAKRILDLEEGPGAPPSSVLRTGSQAPDLHAKDLLGNDFVLSFHSKLPKPVVLYVFSQSCHWCQRNSPSINSLVAQVGSKYRFIGLSLSDTGVGPFFKTASTRLPRISEPIDRYHFRIWLGCDAHYDCPFNEWNDSGELAWRIFGCYEEPNREIFRHSLAELGS